MTNNINTRTVNYIGTEITYQLEWKAVKNLNLRIRANGSVYVSANTEHDPAQVDDFVLKKGEYIISSLRHFKELSQYEPLPKQYVSGETFLIQGRSVRLKVEEGVKEFIESDGVYLHLTVKNKNDFLRKQRIVMGYLDQQCKTVFGEIIAEIYPLFQKYGVTMPTLRIRDMNTRWGSCLAKKGVITLNKRLLEAPRNCIEYVVLHEFCHFIHPNHSKQFYGFMTMLMPDWKERKTILDKSVIYGL